MTWQKDRVFKNGADFVKWLDSHYSNYINYYISAFDIHHTWKPNHSNYPKYSTLELHMNMRNYHVKERGWGDIGQHITNGKDGKIVLGRDIASSPASAYGHNGSAGLHPFMIENIGNFDEGHDTLSGAQLASLEAIGHYLLFEKKKELRFHREMDGRKSCPGTGIDKKWLYNRMKAYSLTPQTKGYLVEGDQGLAVEDMQQRLNALGYYLKVDGLFGPKTEKALKQFQADHGLEVDGSYGPISVKTLLKAGTQLNQPKIEGDGYMKETGFKDVNPYRNGAEAVTKAKKYGLIQGFADGTYRPDQPVSRMEAAMMIVRSHEALLEKIEQLDKS